MTYPERIEIRPAVRPVDAEVTLPGSKSYTNRALVLAALAEGTSTIREALFSDDTRYMALALEALGLPVAVDAADRTFTVLGSGGRIPAAQATLFVGNSGTSARFLTALVALGHGEYVIDGVERMRRRPIEPLLDALRQIGIDAAAINGTGCPPVRIRTRGLPGGRAVMPGSESSQYFSALLMVGPLARSGLDLEVVGDLVSKPYVDLTASTMRAFGATMENHEYRRFIVPGGQRYRAADYAVEPDASAASYFFALAAVTGGRVRVRHLGVASAQGDARFADVLERMGCGVTRAEDFIEVRGPERLRGVDVDMNAISDTAQSLAAIAPLADGPVIIRNIAHVRGKETDRIRAVVTELRRLGIEADELADGLVVRPGPVRPARIATYDDHRMAMSFAILGCAVSGITIDDPGCVSKTFPDFFERLAQVVG